MSCIKGGMMSKRYHRFVIGVVLVLLSGCAAGQPVEKSQWQLNQEKQFEEDRFERGGLNFPLR